MPFPWLIAALVAAAWGWFSWQGYWQSDDFIAIHHAQSWSLACADLFGNQYGLEAVIWLYRPIITLSFALDVTLGGTPFVSHMHNVVLHGINATLLALIVHRVWQRGAGAAWCAGLIWGLSPAHTGVVAWAVGRTGIYCTLFLLLSIWTFLRFHDGRLRTRLWSLVLFALALMSKELAIALPGIILVLGYVLANREARLPAALRAVWPYVLLLLVYLLWRILLFGTVGGYEHGGVDPIASITGLGAWLLRLVDPWIYAGLGYSRQFWDPIPGAVTWLGLLPAGIAILLFLKHRELRTLLVLAILFLGCAIPIWQFWPYAGNNQDLRLFYLPGIAVAVFLSVGSWRTGVLALLVQALPFLQLQDSYTNNWQVIRTQHQELLRSAREEDRYELLFVAGLPRQNSDGTAVAFHLGVDRLTRAPFDGNNKRCMALRPLDVAPGANRLLYGDTHGVPFERTISFTSPRILAGLTHPALSALRLQYDGPKVLTVEILERLARDEIQGTHDLTNTPKIRILGRRAPIYRVTVFTAGGYLTALVPDSSADGSSDGVFTIRDLLFASSRWPPRKEHALAFPLREPTALDLDPRLPVLVEIDEQYDQAGGILGFHPTHANRQPIYLELDRRYATLVRR